MRRNPPDAIRQHCLVSCMNGHRRQVRECARTECPLHGFRMREPNSEGRPLRSIRRYCLECAGGDRPLIRSCQEKEHCPLWPHRFGVTQRSLRRMAQRTAPQRQLRLPGLP
jgi:hypothetical protein